MKSFVIKGPGKGKTTCALVRQFYDKVSRRTKTTYLGSFNTGIDPARLPAGIRTRPGFELDVLTLEDIRAWLEQRGTFGQNSRTSSEVLMEARRQVLAELEETRLASSQSNLDAAATVLLEASLEVQARAAQLCADGVELSKGFLTFRGTDPAGCCNDMDFLKVLANRIRAATISFEEALKAARLMKRVTKQSKLPDIAQSIGDVLTSAV